jgi:hypothetical protein
MPIERISIGARDTGDKSELPSLVGKRMIVQPLVCKHAPEKDKTERCMGFSGLRGTRVLPFTETKKFQSESYLLHRVGPERRMPKTNRKMNDVPDSQKNSGWLEQGGQQEGTDGIGQVRR